MTLKLKSILVAALLASGGAIAAPAMQSCSPMEILHSGTSGLSYALECSVGDWRLKYVGSVPAGANPVTVQYTVTAHNNADGSRFNQVRSTRVLSPALLGQALLREAVVLDNGALAMRDCKEAECSLYRPLGMEGKLAKATITVTPQMQALQQEKDRLDGALAAKQAELAERNSKVAALEGELKALQQALRIAQDDLQRATAQHDAKVAALKSQFDADLAGLSAADKAEREKLQVQAQATLQSSQAAVANLNTEGVRTQEALADAIKARDSALAEKEALAQSLIEKDAMIRDMHQDLELLARLYKEASDGAFVLLDKYKALEQEKQMLEGNLNDMHNQLTLANTKVEAATLARDLSLQAADVAHLDADTLHKANQKLGLMLNEKDAAIQRLTESLATSQAPAPSACEESKPEAASQDTAQQNSPALTKAGKQQVDKAQKLEAQLIEVLPELYALRYKVEKAEKQRDEARASLQALQKAAETTEKAVKPN